MYSGVVKNFSRYWQTYGGISALFKSPYLHSSLIFLLISSHYWINDEWWDLSISVLPNLLGFSLAGFAMFICFGDEKFRSLLAEQNDDKSPTIYMRVCSTFVHFILLQFLALIFAVLFKSLYFYFQWPDCLKDTIYIGTTISRALGFLLFLYSITSMLAATMAIFRMCFWYEVHQNTQNKHHDCCHCLDNGKLEK